MKRTITAFALLLGLLANHCFAATFPGYDPESFGKLIERAINEGTPVEIDNWELRSLARIVPGDTSLPHSADYFSTIGGHDSEGNYQAYFISMVSEYWFIDEDGNWDIKQRIWRVDVSGDLTQLSHSRIIETPDRMVVSIESIPTGSPEDSEELKILGDKVASWLNP